MQKKSRILSIILTITILCSGCSSFSIPSNVNAAFENFTLNLFCQDVASNTLGLHYTLENPDAYGISYDSVSYGSFSADETAELAAIENCQALLNKFPYQSLSAKNQITYDVLASYLDTSLEGIQYTLYEEPLSPLTGIHAQLPVLLAEYSFHSVEDVEIYLKLLYETPDYFSSLIEFETRKSQKGLFMSDSTADEVIKQCNAFISMDDQNYLFSTFEERLAHIESLSTEQKKTFILENYDAIQTAVLPAYEQLVSALTELKGTGKNEQGLCYFPNGKKYYSYLALRETGSSRSVDDMLLLIENQITTDLLDMQKLLSSSPDLLKHVSYTSANSPDLIIKELEQKIETTFPTPENVNVKIKYVPSALEPYLSPAFYLIPAIDNTSENVIYINQAHPMENIHLFTTLAHEGYPGHLYQTTYFASTSPDPLRCLFNFKGYVEGWATYAEMCSYYLSPLPKDYATFLQKNSSLILGLYAKADIGIHYQGWNLERTLQFFESYGIDDLEVIQEIYELIIGDPANYLTYYIGYLEILDLKKEFINQKGDDFTQKEFHKMFLDAGPAPFKIVNKLLMGT